MNSGKMPMASSNGACSRTSAAGEVVERVDLAGVAHAQRHAEVAQLGVLAARHEPLQRLDREHRLAAALDLARGQVVGIGAVEVRG